MDFSIVSIDFSAHIRKIINKFCGNIPAYHECLVDLLTNWMNGKFGVCISVTCIRKKNKNHRKINSMVHKILHW